MAKFDVDSTWRNQIVKIHIVNPPRRGFRVALQAAGTAGGEPPTVPRQWHLVLETL